MEIKEIKEIKEIIEDIEESLDDKRVFDETLLPRWIYP